MSRQQCAGCFLPAAEARRPAVTDGGGDRQCQRTENTDFQPSLRLLSPVTHYLMVIFSRIPLFLLLKLNL